MNVSSGLQIRQLLFPDAVEGGVRAFKAPNPHYEELMAQGVKPRPRKWTELELHGLWVAAGLWCTARLLLALLELHRLWGLYLLAYGILRQQLVVVSHSQTCLVADEVTRQCCHAHQLVEQRLRLLSCTAVPASHIDHPATCAGGAGACRAASCPRCSRTRACLR
jgi:hypothetical protein